MAEQTGWGALLRVVAAGGPTLDGRPQRMTISQNDVLTAIDIVALVASGMRRN